MPLRSPFRWTLPVALAAVLAAGAGPQDRLGLGVATVAVADGVRLDLYASPGDAAAAVGFEVARDTTLLTATLRPSPPAWFRPETLSMDFGLLAFRVVSETEGALEVVVDQETGRTLWLRRGPAVTFKPWAQYLVEDVTGLDLLDPVANPIRQSPNDRAAVVSNDGVEDRGWGCLAVAEVQGEWARVRRSDLCTFGDTPPVDGWVRWRDGGALLIGYGLTC